MANYTIDEVFTEFLKQNSDKYPNVTVTELMDYNESIKKFPEDRWYDQYNLLYITGIDAENLSVVDLMQRLEPYKNDKSFIISTVYEMESITIFQRIEADIQHILDISKFTLNRFIENYLNHGDDDSIAEQLEALPF